MQIRLIGTAAEIEQAIAHLKRIYIITSDSSNHRGLGHVGRQITVSGKSEPQAFEEIAEEQITYVQSPEYYDYP